MRDPKPDAAIDTPGFDAVHIGRLFGISLHYLEIVTQKPGFMGSGMGNPGLLIREFQTD